jgi:hypothetical protein
VAVSQEFPRGGDGDTDADERAKAGGCHVHGRIVAPPPEPTTAAQDDYPPPQINR